MPGVYKIPMVRMTEMSDEAPECKGLKVPHSEMGVWVKAQAVRFSRNGCYETPWHVTGVSKLSGPEGTPKGMYVQIGLSEQGKAGSLLDNPAKNNTHVLLYRHRIFLHCHAALFLTFRRSGSVPAVRKEKRMYFDAKEFGKRLHDVRTSRGITQEELAVRLGLASKQHVSRMENGERSCSIDLLIELSCILHVSTDYLLMGSEPSKEEVKNDLLSIISELSTIAKKI